jgi:N utilization substance protein B
MRFRRQARERAIQFLFQHDVNPPEAIEEELDRFWKSQTSAAIAEDHQPATWGKPSEPEPPTPEDDEVRQFGDPLIRGVLEKLSELDGIIGEQTRNWDIERIAKVDRNILRLAIYEMLHRDDIPPVVSINEAIDIAKKFSTENSGRFVNGILDKVKGRLMRPARTTAN